MSPLKSSLAVLLFFALATPGRTAQKSWDAGGGTANWMDADNWNSNGVPASTDEVTINHAWQGTAASFPVNLGGTERIITGGTLNLTGASSSAKPTIENGYFTTGGSAVINAQNAVITAGIRGSSSNYLLGNLTFEDVVYNNTSYPWECRGKTWSITGGQITNNKGFSVKSVSSGTASGSVTFSEGGPYQFDTVIVGEYADGATRFATLTVQNGAVLKALNATSVGHMNVTGGYGRMVLDNATHIATRNFTVTQKGTLTVTASVIEFRPTNTYTFSIATTTPAAFDGEGLTLKAFPNPGKTGLIEAAGTDFGADPQGFDENYSLDELQLGETENAVVQLVDNCNNHGVAGSWTPEALYVDTVRVLGDTTLDLNGSNGYFRSFISEDGATLSVINGSLTQVGSDDTVEPGTVVAERPTLASLGVRWYVDGDQNRNSMVAVEYRVNNPAASWNQALPLLRIAGETMASGDALQWTAPHLFAGSILDLEEDTEYEIRLTMSDPDGIWQGDGSVLLSEQRTIVLRTRKTPAAGSGTERHVYPGGWGGSMLTPNYPDIAAAYVACSNGDIVTLHAGTYLNGSGFVMNKAATIDEPITIRSAGDGEVILDGDGASVLLNLRQAKYHIIEGLTLRKAYQLLVASDNFHASEGVAVKRCFFDSTTGPTVYSGSYHFAIRSTSKSCRDLYIADSTFAGPKTSWQASAAPYPYGILVAGQGHVICHNRISGYRDGIDFGILNPIPSDPESLNNAIDIYNNDISECDDDGVQLDFGFHNLRFMRNYVHRTMMGISFQPVYAGPAYVYRNIFYNQASSALKTNGWPSGLLVFNNTFAPSKSAASFGAFWQNSKFFNNLFMGTDGANRVLNHGTPTPDVSELDYNGYHWHSTPLAWKITWTKYSVPDGVSTPVVETQNSYTSFSSFVLAKGFEANGVATLEPTDFVSYIPPTGAVTDSETGLDLRLTATSGAIDKGTFLDNITPSPGGTAPDLGACEYGAALPVYGPR